jgi:hypothetical protein
MKNKIRVYPEKAIFGWEEDNGVGEMLIKQIKIVKWKYKKSNLLKKVADI